MERVKSFIKTPAGTVSLIVLGIIVVCVGVYFIVSDDTDDANSDDPGSSESGGGGDDGASNADDAPDEETEVDLSSDEITALESKSRDMISTVGTFGVDRSEFSGELTMEEMEESGIFTSRAENYRSVEEDIAEDSDYFYEDSRIDSWENEALAGAVVDEVSVDDVSGPEAMTVAGEQVRSAEVELSWEGTEYFYEVTATDTSWDGSFFEMERDYSESGVNLVFVKTSDGWKFYEVNGLDNVHTTTLWSSPAPERMPFRDQFEQVNRTEATREVFDEESVEDVEAPEAEENELDEKIESDIDRGLRDRMYSPPAESEE